MGERRDDRDESDMDAPTSTSDVLSQSDDELFEVVADALLALSGVELGDFSTRLEVPDDSGVLTSLFAGINDMISALGQEQRRLDEYRADREQRLATIEQQREAIRELSTPILEVWDNVLCLPVVGVVDTMRSSEMTAELLEAIARRRMRYAIIDVTGIDVMDTSTAHHFLQMANAASLLGASCVITGLNPSIAQTVVHMGVNLTGLVTFRSLRDALGHIIRVEDEARAARRRRLLAARSRVAGGGNHEPR